MVAMRVVVMVVGERRIVMMKMKMIMVWFGLVVWSFTPTGVDSVQGQVEAFDAH